MSPADLYKLKNTAPTAEQSEARRLLFASMQWPDLEGDCRSDRLDHLFRECSQTRRLKIVFGFICWLTIAAWIAWMTLSFLSGPVFGSHFDVPDLTTKQAVIGGLTLVISLFFHIGLHDQDELHTSFSIAGIGFVGGLSVFISAVLAGVISLVFW